MLQSGQQRGCDTSSPTGKCVLSEISMNSLFAASFILLLKISLVLPFIPIQGGKMHWWCGAVSFCCVFAGGTQALMCIDTPLLLIILEVIYLFTTILVKGQKILC